MVSKRVKMNIKKILDLKIGGQWLVSPNLKKPFFVGKTLAKNTKILKKWS